MKNSLALRAFTSGRDLVRKAAVSALGIRNLFPSIRESFSGAWQRGVTIDPIGTLTSFGAVFACISRNANDIGKLEPQLRIVGEDGISKLAPSASPYWTVLRRPNRYQDRIQFFVYWVTCKLLFGNCYVIKERNDLRGLVTALHIIDPRRVTAKVTPEGDVYYSISGSDLAGIPTGVVLPASEVIHDRGATLWHPLIGVSPIYACGSSATQGLRIQGNSSMFFENMSRPSGMLTSDGTIDDVTAARLKKAWEENYSGQNIGRLAVGGDGLKYLPMTIPAEDAQLVEQLGWTVEDVARCFAMPLYKIGAGTVPTAGNVEALQTQYYTDCLQILIESIERCLTDGLGVPAGYEVEFDLEGLLRMDAASQIKMLADGVHGGIYKPNEARAKRNLAAVPGGDAVYLQQQNYSLSALAKRDASEDPFGTKKAEPKPTEPPPIAEDDEAATKAVEMLAKDAAEQARALEAISEQITMAADQARRANEEAARVAEQREAADRVAKEAAAEAERQAEIERARQEQERMAAVIEKVAAMIRAAEEASVQREQKLIEQLKPAEPDLEAFADEVLKRFAGAELLHG